VNRISALIKALPLEKKIEVAFIAVFSVVILITFYLAVSMNGVVLGNDPAVHLEKAQIFLNTGGISLANLGWTPPLYEIILALIISFTGVSQIAQYVVVLRVLTAVLNWLLIMSAYLLARKFFNRKVAYVAVIMLLLSFPLFEANQFGGYTTVLAIAFLLLMLLYTPLAVEHLGYLVVTFFTAFGLVLGHQVATFLAAFIMPPILLYMLIKSRGKNLKVVLAIICGGGIAFFLYYFQAMYKYLDLVIEYVFFAIKSYAYQIPAVTLDSFIVKLGFVFFLGLAGVGVSFYWMRKEKKSMYWLILALVLFVPFFFAESWLVGFYMPFSWFVYYMTPPLAILAAVTVVFAWDKAFAYYGNHRSAFKKNWVRAVTVCIIALLCVMVVYRGDVLYGKIQEAGVYYSTTDIKAMDAGLWLKDNYPNYTVVVSTEVPGFWFQEFSGKNVTAQTDPTVQRMEIAEAVLSLSYELEHNQTMLKAYQAKGDTLNEYYVSMNQVWERVSFSSGSGDFLYYTLNGVRYEVPLNQLSKSITFNNNATPMSITFQLSNDVVALTKTITAVDNSYRFNTNWTLTPLRSEVQNASLYLTTLFDLQYKFEVVDIPGLLDWVNPYDAPTGMLTKADTWAAASFTGADLKDNYLGVYDDTNQLGYAFYFNTTPEWGNIGSGFNRQLDAVRFQYNFNDVAAGQTVSASYDTLTLSKSSCPQLTRDTLHGLLDYHTQETVKPRSFSDYLKNDNVGFIVYDRNELDPQVINSRMLQLVYSNDRYVIFKIIK
jgi:hypothetical protein